MIQIRSYLVVSNRRFRFALTEPGLVTYGTFCHCDPESIDFIHFSVSRVIRVT